MNKETRIQKIQEIIENNKNKGIFSVEIPWRDSLEVMQVFKIPLKYLVYNKYNGRILSRTKSLESQKLKIDVESEDGRVLIEKLLWESNLDRNKQTQESLKKIGQEKVGIITKDGIIIDGNRRAMLLNRIGEKDYFKAVVLSVSLEEDPLEIAKLETSYQMGEDEKVGYNPIEKYLKVKDFKKRGVTTKKIAAWMGKEEAEIKEYIEVMAIMDDYLEYLDYSGIYTQLDGREDQLIKLTQWCKNFYGEGSAKAFDGYRDADVDDLKTISFDYIRVQYEGKDFRKIAYGRKENHFFGDKKIWQDFRDFHFKHVEPIQQLEGEIKYNSENIEDYLNDRDKKFFESTKSPQGESFLDENITIHFQQIQNKKR
jgi:hypothetical protein